MVGIAGMSLHNLQGVLVAVCECSQGPQTMDHHVIWSGECRPLKIWQKTTMQRFKFAQYQQKVDDDCIFSV